MTSEGKLPTARLGTTDMSFSRVGLGTWAMGGLGPKMVWGPADDDESDGAIVAAIERGINWVDTAAFYGYGHSEEVLGAVLAKLPEDDRPYVSTKCGLRWGLAEKTLRIASPESLRWELDESLRRLGVDHIDLYFLHWPPDDGTPLEEYWGLFADFRREGKIVAAGLSNHSAAQLEAAEAVSHVDAVQPPFSAIDRTAAGELIPWCLDHDVAVVNYAPMQSGLLSGAFSEERVKALPDNDWRKTNVNFTGEKFQENMQFADALRPIAAKHDCSVGAVAVAWTLAVPGVTSAIVGARRPSQVDLLVTAAALELDTEDLVNIAGAIESSGAGKGPVFSPEPAGDGADKG
jgi:aryl-alcohol dehydrogenase-like predicted oxidoreductase